MCTCSGVIKFKRIIPRRERILFYRDAIYAGQSRTVQNEDENKKKKTKNDRGGVSLFFFFENPADLL